MNGSQMISAFPGFRAFADESPILASQDRINASEFEYPGVSDFEKAPAICPP